MKCLKISFTDENGHSLLINYDDIAFKFVVSHLVLSPFFFFICGIGKLLENNGWSSTYGKSFRVCDCFILKLKEAKSRISIWLKKMVLFLHFAKFVEVSKRCIKIMHMLEKGVINMISLVLLLDSSLSSCSLLYQFYVRVSFSFDLQSYYNFHQSCLWFHPTCVVTL